MKKLILVTGGSGFVGKGFIQYLLDYTDYHIISLDKNSQSLKFQNNRRVSFICQDLTTEANQKTISKLKDVTHIFHLAGSTNVDVSVKDPVGCVLNNVVGTANILNYARLHCNQLKLFLFLSTAEVFGSATSGKSFKEGDRLNPLNPYSASKASAESLCSSFKNTYDLPIIVCNTSNIYGPYHLANRYISVIINKILKEERLSVYCTRPEHGIPSRQYLYSHDLFSAFLFLMSNGITGEHYNIASEKSVSNLDLAFKISKIMSKSLNYQLIFSQDSFCRHEHSHLLSTNRIRNLGWAETFTLKDGLIQTINWHMSNHTQDNV